MAPFWPPKPKERSFQPPKGKNPTTPSLLCVFPAADCRRLFAGDVLPSRICSHSTGIFVLLLIECSKILYSPFSYISLFHPFPQTLQNRLPQ
ncbi:hypothetical protein Hanom_Chr12g01130951 [Helianthus anomalus]